MVWLSAGGRGQANFYAWDKKQQQRSHRLTTHTAGQAGLQRQARGQELLWQRRKVGPADSGSPRVATTTAAVRVLARFCPARRLGQLEPACNAQLSDHVEIRRTVSKKALTAAICHKTSVARLFIPTPPGLSHLWSTTDALPRGGGGLAASARYLAAFVSDCVCRIATRCVVGAAVSDVALDSILILGER